MQPDRADRFETHCLHCHTPVAEEAEACPHCSASFAGSGRFDKVRGPAPSELFRALFADREPFRSAALLEEREAA